MATITGLTAARMLEIEGMSVVDGEVIGGHLILTKHDGTTIDAGPVLGPAGPSGPAGPAGGQIPGELKLWSGTALPDPVLYGKWVWADGAYYASATYPKAAANIANEWRTFAGASDPSPSNFRVPDMRGLVPAGLDAMPGGARANRMTRAVAITIAAKTGEETHIITVSEMAQHSHVVDEHGGHRHTPQNGGDFPTLDSPGGPGGYQFVSTSGPDSRRSYTSTVLTGITINNAGGNNGHETVQPTVMIPYIVKLDD